MGFNSGFQGLNDTDSLIEYECRWKYTLKKQSELVSTNVLPDEWSLSVIFPAPTSLLVAGARTIPRDRFSHIQLTLSPLTSVAMLVRYELCRICGLCALICDLVRNDQVD